MADTYKIVRNYMDRPARTIKTGLTLEQAQAHCRDLETSSKTCLRYVGRQRTRHVGPWFDGYDRE